MSNRQVQILTDSDRDESPSFSPNGRMVLLATVINERGVLSAVSADGRVKQRLSTAAGDDAASRPVVVRSSSDKDGGNTCVRFGTPVMATALLFGCATDEQKTGRDRAGRGGEARGQAAGGRIEAGDAGPGGAQVGHDRLRGAQGSEQQSCPSARSISSSTSSTSRTSSSR